MVGVVIWCCWLLAWGTKSRKRSGTVNSEGETAFLMNTVLIHVQPAKKDKVVPEGGLTAVVDAQTILSPFRHCPDQTAHRTAVYKTGIFRSVHTDT